MFAACWCNTAIHPTAGIALLQRTNWLDTTSRYSAAANGLQATATFVLNKHCDGPCVVGRNNCFELCLNAVLERLSAIRVFYMAWAHHFRPRAEVMTHILTVAWWRRKRHALCCQVGVKLVEVIHGQLDMHTFPKRGD